MFDTLALRQELIGQLNRLMPLAKIQAAHRIPTVRNLVYAASTREGGLLLKLAPKSHSESLRREHQSICALSLRGAPVPCPMPLGDDEVVVSLNGVDHLVYGYQLILGQPLEPSVHDFYALGASIGRLHNAWEAVKRPAWLPVVAASDLLDSAMVAIGELQPCGLQEARRLCRMVSAELEAHQDVAFLGFVHGDAHHMNAIKAGEGEVVLFDLEDAGWHWRAYDLATAIWGSFSLGGTAEVWNGLIAGYSSVRPLCAEEASLIRYLIFARHVWWLGLHARNWSRWCQEFNRTEFFGSGLELLGMIAHDVCGLSA